MVTKPSLRHSHVARLAIRFLIALQVILVIVIATSVTFQTNYTKNNILHNNLDYAVTQSINLETMLTQNLNLLRMHLLNMQLEDIFDEDTLYAYKGSVIVKLSNILNKLTFVRSISIVDDNNYIVSSTTIENIGYKLDTDVYLPENAKYIVGALRFGNPLLGRDFYNCNALNKSSDKNDEWDDIKMLGGGFLPVAMKLPERSGWTAVATINSDYFINSINNASSVDNLISKAYLDNGSIIFSSNLSDVINRLSSNFDGYDSNKKRAFQSIDNEKIVAYRSSNSYPFFVKTKLLKQDVLSEWQKTARKLQIAAVVIVLLLLVITVYLTKRVHRLLTNQARLYKENEEAIEIWRQQELQIRKLLQAVEQSPTSILITDLTGAIEYANTEFYASTGYSPTEVIGANPNILSSGMTPPKCYKELWKTLVSGNQWEGELINKRKNGEIYIERALISPLKGLDGNISNYVGVKYEITEEKKREKELKLAASVMANTLDGVFICDANKNIIDINPAFIKITGYSHEDVIGKNPRILSSGRHNAEFYASMWSLIDSVGYWQGEIWNQRKDGSLYAALSNVSIVHDENGKVGHYINVFSDITQLKTHQKNLESLVHYDPLTQLPNRVLLQDRLEVAMAKTTRENKMLVVCFMDLDGFKAVNDTYGHKAGDELLKVIATRLEENIRKGDTAARLGGDEFVMLLTSIDSIEQYEKAASRILRAVENPILLSNSNVYVTGSMGITVYPQDDSEAEQLMRHADHAMYQAKQAGRNRFVVYDPLTDALAKQTLEYIDEIKNAIKNNEFEVFYQPKLNLRLLEVVGCEALIRWNHPVRGKLLPEYFMPRIMENNLEHEIDLWVIKKVLSQLEKWRIEKVNIHSVSINIGANLINNSDFVDIVQDLIKKHPSVKSKQIEFEVLESSAIRSLSSVHETLKKLRNLGFKIALDDFGTGYSSLSLLQRLPITTLKIDKSFINKMLLDRNDLSIVESVIRLAMAFKHEVIAEGVETISHAQVLASMGCYVIQGYCVSKPLGSKQLKEWLNTYDIKGTFKNIVDTSISDIKSTVAAATLQHRIWIGKLEDFMAGNVKDFDSTIELDPKKCSFATWQHWAETQTDISRNPIFEKIKLLHTNLHQTGYYLVDAIKSGDKEKSKSLIKLLYRQQSDFLTKLEEIQK